MSTFNDVLTAVRVNTARNDAATDSMIYQAYCMTLELLDRAQEWDEHDHTKSKNLLLAGTSVDLSTFTDDGGAPKYIKSVQIATYSPMLQYTKKKWEECIEPGTATTGRPTAFVYYRKFLYFNTIADVQYALSVRYQDRPAKPTSVSDTTAAVPFEDMDSAIIALTTAQVWGSLEERENMQMWVNMAKTLIQGMTQEAQRILDLSPAVGAKATNSRAQGVYWLDPFASKGGR